MRKNKRKEKSIVVSQNFIHLVVPPTFFSGSTPLFRKKQFYTVAVWLWVTAMLKWRR